MTFQLLHFLAWTCCVALLAARSHNQEVGFDLVTPVILATKPDNSLSLQIAEYVLHLEQQALPPVFTSTYFKNHQRVVEHDFAGCIYRGEVEGHPGWSVSLTICSGVLGHFGDDENKEYYYHIEPLDIVRSDSDYSVQIEVPHIFYAESSSQFSANLSSGMCATTPEFLPRRTKLKQRLTPLASQVFEPGHRIVELVVVNDHTQYLQRNKRVPSVILRNIEIVDYMNQLYSTLNISVALVGVVTWTERDLIHLPADMDPVRLLISFKDYYYYIPGLFDCALLISGKDFKESIVGLAYKSSMCYGRYSVGVVQDRRPTLSGVGGTATHELAHILGMSHDEMDGRPCSCADPTGKCIMASVAPHAQPSTHWSNCSLADMEASFAAYPSTESCLYNEPVANVSRPEALELPAVQGKCFKLRALLSTTLLIALIIIL